VVVVVWRRGPKRKDVDLNGYSSIGQAKRLLCRHLVVATLFFEVRVLYLCISKPKALILFFFKFCGFVLYYVLAERDGEKSIMHTMIESREIRMYFSLH